MNTQIRYTITSLAVALAATAALVIPTPSLAAEPPVKEILISHLGWEVDPVTKGPICTISPGHECQAGKASSQPGGFEHPEGIAGARNGDVYVADRGNHRVQELTAAGVFVLMFGWDVNKTKVTQAAKGASVTQAQENVCRAGEECQAGVRGPAPGQFDEGIPGIAVDPVNGDVYIADRVKYGNGEEGESVQKFTGEGVFVLEIGQEVNETRTLAVKAKGGTPSPKELEEENLCTQEEALSKGVKCTGPTPGLGHLAPAMVEPGAFVGVVGIGDITVGGPEDRLYVGEETHVQEFTAAGIPVAEPAEAISRRLMQVSTEPESHVSGIAVDNSCSLHEPVLSESTTPTCKEFDPSYGDIYLTYNRYIESTSVIRRFDATGKETEFPVSPRAEGMAIAITEHKVAVDPDGRLAVIEAELHVGSNGSKLERGVLYQPGVEGLHLITEFKVPQEEASFETGVAFNGSDDLYTSSVFSPGVEVSVYNPVPVGELVAGSSTSCQEGAEDETDATFRCPLTGQVDPWGVPQTEAWFQWGRTTGLGSETPKQVICTVSCGSALGAVPSASVEGLRPNETFYFQAAGRDANVQPPELLTSERVSFLTPTTRPRIVGEASVSHVHFSSVVFSGEVNPENAQTQYSFQYGACESGLEGCTTLSTTEGLQSNAYGVIATTLEASGLQPATTYHYRLIAENDHAQSAVGPEQAFTTAPAPVPQAQTGAASLVTATSAVISGDVNPDGEAAVYTFELGLYNGSSTSFGIVLSASAGASSVPVEQALGLTGLEPGRTYAYRIVVKSGFGEMVGATATFTTEGLPAVLPLPLTPGLLALPSIAFPNPVITPSTKKTKPKKTKTKKKKTKKGTKKAKRGRVGKGAAK